MKAFILSVLILLFFQTYTYCQRRGDNGLHRHTDESRQRPELVNQDRKREEDPSGKMRNTPRPEQYSGNHDRQIDRRPEENYVAPPSDNSSSGTVYEPYYPPPEEPPAQFYFDLSIEYSDPEPPVVIYTTEKAQALRLIQNQNYTKAIRLLTSAINNNLKDLELYFLRGIAETGAEYYKDAVEDFDYYLKCFNDDGEGFYRRGLAKFLDREKEEARKDLDTAVIYGSAKARQLIRKYYN